MDRPIRALLLAAGLGTRLRPLTFNIPKCLVEINEKTLLNYWIDNLEDINVEKILINTHYLAEKVNQFLDNQYSKKTNIERFHENKLMGTAGTLIANYNFFLNSTGILIHSDNFTNMRLFDLLKAHFNRPKGSLITMLTFTTSNPQSCGIVELDKDNIVLRFHEKVKNPPGNTANGAIYVFENEFLEWLIKNHPHAKDFSNDVLPFLTGKIFTYHTKMPYIDIGTPKRLKEARSIKIDRV